MSATRGEIAPADPDSAPASRELTARPCETASTAGQIAALPHEAVAPRDEIVPSDGEIASTGGEMIVLLDDMSAR